MDRKHDLKVQLVNILGATIREVNTLTLERDQIKIERDLVHERLQLLQKECHDTKRLIAEISPARSSAQSEVDVDQILSRLSTESQKNEALVQCKVLNDENAKLKEVVALLETENTKDRIIWIEKIDSLQKTITSLEEGIIGSNDEVDRLQQSVQQLQDRLHETETELRASLAREALQNIRVNTEREPEVPDKLLQAREELQALKATIESQQREIEQLRREATQHAAQSSESQGQSVSRPKRRYIRRRNAANENTDAISIPSSDEDDDEDDDTAALDEEPLVLHQSGIPQRRWDVLQRLPPIEVVFPADVPRASFTRTMLSNILGGASQALIVVVAHQKALSARHDITKYICPKMDHNSWLPSAPGQHGYMFVGLGLEKFTFVDAERLHVFVGKGSEHEYAGLYEVVRDAPLLSSEWRAVAPNVRQKYCETTLDKEQAAARAIHAKSAKEAKAARKQLSKFKTTSEIGAAYEDGRKRVPCVRLQCIGFDMDFYRSLVAARSGLATVPSTPQKRSAGDGEHGSAKKARAAPPTPSASASNRKSDRLAARDVEPKHEEQSDLTDIDDQ
ncbi:uncharacterized protein LAESUDRAFT_205924 [Laetiporus sulphureus 93-53]|uniref:DUF6697 domain-containing protein n=1 Tax=Laetiporus sulphureus 93-53 TaxID=1314785 RepID=A0A165DYZ7_9APHY|nr:uncharacterized protein LAESUDRAFT_205924 [Laetiporus sulphureus 93-53]KZT05920.1 hypothetical protein LAESUDRAFT_205924 [Laetiporus sulphureus 93-53]